MDLHTQKENIEDADLRCNSCGKLLAKGSKSQMCFEIKCNRCGSINSIFKGIKDQVVITDKEGTILYANPIVESLTGYSLSEILGKKPSLWGGQMPKEFYKEMWHKISVEKVPISVDVKNKKKDGTLYNANLKISPVFGKDNEVSMYVGIETIIE
jgi:PAS domain S-box-containing protein